MAEELESLSTLLRGLNLMEHATALALSRMHATEAAKILTEGIGGEKRTNAELVKERVKIHNELERLEKKAKEAQGKAGQKWRRGK